MIVRQQLGEFLFVSDPLSAVALVPMDADLQNDPLDIPNLLEQIDSGYDVCSGWRKDRKDDYLTRTFPRLRRK